jgi:hypothetical protein
MQEKKSTAKELLAEVQEIRDMLAVIEKRSKYLKPPSIRQAATRSLLTGVAQGFGVFVGGTIIVGLTIFALTHFLRNGIIQDFIGQKIEESINNAINERLPSLPFRN